MASRSVLGVMNDFAHGITNCLSRCSEEDSLTLLGDQLADRPIFAAGPRDGGVRPGRCNAGSRDKTRQFIPPTRSCHPHPLRVDYDPSTV